MNHDDDAPVPLEEAPETDAEAEAREAAWGPNGYDGPSYVWLELHAKGLVKYPYRGGRNRRKLEDMPPPIKFKGTDEDILRSLGRLDDR